MNEKYVPSTRCVHFKKKYRKKKRKLTKAKAKEKNRGVKDENKRFCMIMLPDL